MTKKLQTLFCSLIFISKIFAQSPSAVDPKTASISNYYKLAVQYKDGKGVPMDYKLAYENFSKAAALGDPQSIYAMGYMSYKGLV